MRIGDTIKSKFLKVTDLPGRESGHADLTIAGFSQGRYSDGRESLDMAFVNTEKTLGLNVTNKRRLMEMFGEDVELDDMVGKRVRAYAERTQDSGGRDCWGIRLCAPPDTVQSASAAARNQINAAMAEQGVQPRAAATVPPVPNSSLPTTLRPDALNGSPPETAANLGGDPLRDQEPPPLGDDDYTGPGF